jgi:hypothetical protein
VTADPRTPAAIKTALEDLLQSEGWAILAELVDERYGDAAQLRKIDEAMKALEPADTIGQIAIVTQIRAASKAASAVLAMPKGKLDAVTEHKPTPRMFDSLRRTPRWA